MPPESEDPLAGAKEALETPIPDPESVPPYDLRDEIDRMTSLAETLERAISFMHAVEEGGDCMPGDAEPTPSQQVEAIAIESLLADRLAEVERVLERLRERAVDRGLTDPPAAQSDRPADPGDGPATPPDPLEDWWWRFGWCGADHYIWWLQGSKGHAIVPVRPTPVPAGWQEGDGPPPDANDPRDPFHRDGPTEPYDPGSNPEHRRVRAGT
jgi:hypothetical protein